jgi:hypothetical protein
MRSVSIKLTKNGVKLSFICVWKVIMCLILRTLSR